MNIYLLFIIALVIGYFFGSLPGALIVGKIFYKKDVRTMGSGNLGATNVARSLGAWPGFFTLFFDFFKVILATYLVYFIAINCYFDVNFDYVSLSFCLTGLATCIGHCFPIFANFKGGKCVSVIGGFVIGSNWIIMLIGLLTFIITMLIKKIVSLSSIIMAIVATIFCFFPFVKHGSFIINYSFIYSLTILIMAIILIARHRSNIIKLIHHEEKKFTFKKANKNTSNQ